LGSFSGLGSLGSFSGFSALGAFSGFGAFSAFSLGAFSGFGAFSAFSLGAFSGSILVRTSTGTRPLASASRSATRSPLRPSNSTRVVRASGTTYASVERPASGSSSVAVSPSVVSCSSRVACASRASSALTTRGCTTTWPSRSHDVGEVTSTFSMSCQRRPLQVSP
jgi:hypothetical protein